MATSVDAWVERKYLPLFARPVALFATWLARHDEGPALSAPPVAGWVPLRPTARKVLAFDDQARFFGGLAIIPGLFAGANVLAGLGRLVTGDLVGGLAHAVVASLVTGLVVLVGSLAVAARMVHLSRVFSRCVVMPARVTAAVPTLRMTSRSGGTSRDCA